MNIKETEIHYGPIHLHDILKNEGVKEVAKRWSKLIGQKMIAIEDNNGLVIKRK